MAVGGDRDGLSSNWALSLDGGTWRRYGLISETGLLLFVLLAAGWLAPDQDNVRILLGAMHRRRRAGCAVWHRAVLRVRSLSAAE